MESGEGSDDPGHAGYELGQVAAGGHGLLVGEAGGVHEAAYGILYEIVGLVGGVGAPLAEVGDGNLDEAGVGCAEGVVA